MRTLAQFQRDLVELGSGGLRRVLVRALTAAALSAEREAKIRVGAFPRFTRSGRLRASIGASATEIANGAELRLRAGGGTGQVRYARIQEHGGTIVPRSGKFLAIPVGPALTGAGVSRFASPRDVPDLVLVQSRGGQWMLVKNTGSGRGKREQMQVWYLLRRSVFIPSRPYLAPAMAETRAALPAQLRERVAGAILRGARG